MPGCGCSPPFEYQLYKYLKIKDSSCFKIFTSPFARVESSLESFQVESEVKSEVYKNATPVRVTNSSAHLWKREC